MTLLIDSDVLIDYLRDLAPAVRYFQGVKAAAVSAVTVAEVYAGARARDEESAIEDFLRTVTVLPVDREVGRRGGQLRKQFLPSHKVEIADALIAASSLLHNLTLVTLNRRHYPMIRNLFVPYRK